MRKIKGFSLAEMMIVLLIVAVVAAAAAPMLSKKVANSSAQNSSPWVWTGTNNSIAYNMKGNPDQTASIGSVATPVTEKARLYINSSGNPQIALGHKDKDIISVTSKNKSLFITDELTSDVASAVALGTGTKSTKQGATSIGATAQANHEYSTALGYGAKTTEPKQIVLGTPETTIYIPGDIVVEGSVISKNVAVKENFAARRAFVADRFTVWAEGGARFRKIGALLNRFMVPNLLDAEANWVARNTVRAYPEADLYEDVLKITLPAACDRRLKNVGKEATAGLEEIKKLQVYNFTYKKDPNKTPRVGVIAQDLEKVFPNAVFRGDDGFFRIRMEDMFYGVVNAVKELDLKITTLTKDITGVQEKNKDYEKIISELIEQNKAQEKRITELEKKLKKVEKQ